MRHLPRRVRLEVDKGDFKIDDSLPGEFACDAYFLSTARRNDDGTFQIVGTLGLADDPECPPEALYLIWLHAADLLYRRRTELKSRDRAVVECLVETLRENSGLKVS